MDWRSKATPVTTWRERAQPVERPEIPHWLAAGETAATIGTGLAAKAASGYAGLAGLAVGKGPEFQEATEKALTYEPRSATALRQLQFVGKAAALPGKAIKSMALVPQNPNEPQAMLPEAEERFMETPLGETVGGAVADATGSPLAATVAETAIEGAPFLIAGKGLKPKPKPKATTVADLKTQASNLYKTVDASGLKISAESAARAIASIERLAKSRGVRKKLTPKTFQVIKELKDNPGALTFKQAEELRRVIKQATSSIDKADAAAAMSVLRKWDDFVENLGKKDVAGGAPDAVVGNLKAARGLWAKARKSETVEDLIDTARLNAGMFSGSGFENALRTQFRTLARNAKKMRQFTAAEQAIIRKVAMGGPVENMLRFVGKMAPTGVVSAGFGMGAGFAAGGPLGAVVVPAAGAISRKLATASTLRNAQKASEMMRN